MADTGGAPGALFCDANVLIRLLTDDPPRQARSAEEALDHAAATGIDVILTDVVVAELAYVLTGVYELTNEQASERLGAILDLPAIRLADESVIREAITIWSAQRLDFADAYLAALARSTRNTGVLSFDRDFDRTDGVRRVDPGDLAEG